MVKSTKTSKKDSVKTQNSKKTNPTEKTMKKTTSKVEKKVTKNDAKTTSKKAVKSTPKKTTEKVPEVEAVVNMSSKVLSSMNEKIDTLNSVKKTLEDKLKDLDKKVQVKEKENKTKTKQVSQTQISVLKDTNQTTQNVLSNLKEFKSQLTQKQLDEIKICEDLISNITKELSTSKKITKTTFNTLHKNMLDEITKIVAILQQQKTKRKTSSKSKVSDILDTKVNASELHQLIDPIQTRVNNCFKVIEQTNHLEQSKVKSMKQQLSSQVKEIQNQITGIEKYEAEKVSKTKFKKDFINLKNEIETISTTLNKYSNESKDIEKEVDKLHLIDSKISSQIKEIEAKKNEVTKDELGHQIQLIEQEISNSFKAIEQLSHLEHTDVKKIKSAVSKKFKIVEQIFLKMYEEHTHFLTKDEFKTKTQTLQKEINEVIKALIKADKKDKTIQQEVAKLKELDENLTSHQKRIEDEMEIVVHQKDIQKIVTPIETRITNAYSAIEQVAYQENTKIKAIKDTISTNLNAMEIQIQAVEKEEKTKVSNTKFRKEIKTISSEIEEVIKTLLRADKKDKKLTQNIKALEKINATIDTQIKKLNNKTAKQISKAQHSKAIAKLEEEINTNMLAIQKVDSIENKDVKKLNNKFSTINKIFDDIYATQTHFITKNTFNTTTTKLQDEIKALLQTLKTEAKKDSSLEKHIKEVEGIENQLITNQLNISTQLSSKIEKEDVEHALYPINKKITNCFKAIESSLKVENKNITDVKSKVNTRFNAIQNIISNLNSQTLAREEKLNSHIKVVDKEINEIIKTLVRASKVEKNLEKVVTALTKDDKIHSEQIENIQNKFKTYYTKQHINKVLQQIDEEYEDIKTTITKLASKNSKQYSKIQENLVEQKQEVQSQIKELDETSHQTFATKTFTSQKIKDLKEIEENHDKLHNTQIENIKSNHRLTNKVVDDRVNALKNSLKDLYKLSSHFLDKKEIEKTHNEIDKKIKKINLLEKADYKLVEKQLQNLAKTLGKEVGAITTTIKTLSSQEEVTKVKKTINVKLKNISKEIDSTQKEIINESVKQHKKIEAEHKKVLQIKTILQSSISSLEQKLLEQYLTKSEIQEIEHHLNNKLHKLEKIQDESTQLIEDELTSMFQTAQSHQKQIHTINSRIIKDENVMSTHQEVLDIAKALEEALKQSQKNIKTHSTQNEKKVSQEIDAMLQTEKDKVKRIHELELRLNKTYTKSELDNAFESVADEVEAMKLREENTHKNIEKKIDEVLLKEKKDTSKIKKEIKTNVSELQAKTQDIIEHTNINYLKKELTHHIEDQITKLQKVQQQEMEELVRLQAQEIRLDKAEHFMEEKEQELEEKLKNQFNELQEAKNNWNEFFSNLKAELETDEESLHKAIQNIEILKSDFKVITSQTNELEKNQAPLKQYLIEKYNSIVDAFHAMQKENTQYHKELKSNQEEKIAEYVNSYAQKVMEYEKGLRDAQIVISEYVDLKTANLYGEFEQTIKEHTTNFNNNLQAMQERVGVYLNELEEEKNTFAKLIQDYVIQIDSKIKEVNDLEANLEHVISDAKQNLERFISEKTIEVEKVFDRMLLEKKDAFMQKESNLLTSYNEKVQNLHNHVDNRLDKIEEKFVEKHIKSIQDEIENEFVKTKHVISELKEIREDIYHKEQKVEETLIDSVTQLETKKNEVEEAISKVAEETKENYLNLEDEADKLRREILERTEERMTHFEQHLNKRYLETDSQIAHIKEVLINEVEGLMRDVGVEMSNYQQKFQLALQNKSNESNEQLQQQIAHLQSEQEANNAQLAFTQSNTNQVIKTETQSPELVQKMMQLEQEIVNLKTNSEATNAQLIFTENNSTQQRNQNIDSRVIAKISQLEQEIVNLKTNSEATNAQLAFTEKENTNQNSTLVNELMLKINNLEQEMVKMKANSEVNSAQIAFTSKLNESKDSNEELEILLTKIYNLEQKQTEIQSQVEYNSASSTFSNTDKHLKTLHNNQQKLANEMKKAFESVKTHISETDADLFHIKREVEVMLRDSSIPTKKDSSKELISTMKEYEENIIEMITTLKQKGCTNSEIEEVLIQKGHPQFYVQVIVNNL